MESMATNHKSIGHRDNEKHYFRGELEEFYTDLRNKVNFPALIAESFEISFDDDEKIRETSFIVVCAYGESKNWSNIYGSMSTCESIGDELLRRMMTDADNGEICANVEAVSAIPLLDEQHLYTGMRYTIRVACDFDWEVNDEEWNDLSI